MCVRTSAKLSLECAQRNGAGNFGDTNHAVDSTRITYINCDSEMSGSVHETTRQRDMRLWKLLKTGEDGLRCAACVVSSRDRLP